MSYDEVVLVYQETTVLRLYHGYKKPKHILSIGCMSWGCKNKILCAIYYLDYTHLKCFAVNHFRNAFFTWQCHNSVTVHVK